MEGMEEEGEVDDTSSVVSCSSTGTEQLKYKKRGRLATLLLGSSRQTLFSKSGSKRSFQRSTDASYPNLDANSQDVTDPDEVTGSSSNQRLGSPLSQMFIA
ncbi:hypothetical protein PFISCL1PPCAC_24675 [Pristionchus fissidentatus]|uniref:Uncharacterized protein n=1 Tax=Pristionchus fissidentatus TaxID=1538716 RepID=A0AAV5WPQ9_9BILA|nr:hypothetical protein PFISCL1PPCAC_24675 [Pristionchus fissidentatus]